MTVVQVTQGTLKGKVDRAKDGSQYYTFHNIPYAEAPVGHLRFKAPVKAGPWQGIRDATQEGPECYSRHQIYLSPTGSEDCLSLNVFTKDLKPSSLKPVMVFIHGGGFTTGSSKVEIYGPEHFMCEDIVFVSINYRLGIFGFLSFQDKSLGVPGNAGLKDQVMALRWVQKNIRNFGGEPNNVTIFGESAGAVSVNCHLCSPMSRGLFHKAIMQSGSVLNSWCWGRPNVRSIAEYFKLKTEDESEILQCLQSVSKEDLLKAQFKQKDRYKISEIRPFGIVIEGLNNFEESFLPDDPYAIIKSGNYNKVPIITGFNTHEGMLLDIIESRMTHSLLITDFEEAIPVIYQIPKGSAKSLQIAAKIKKFYYGNKEPLKEDKEEYYSLQTDTFFLRGIYVMLRTILETSAKPAYFYRFSLDGELNVYKKAANITWPVKCCLKHKPAYFYRFSLDGELNVYKKAANITWPGVCHGDDIFYMFSTILTPEFSDESLEAQTIKRFIKFWTNFARTGNPNSTGDKEWPQADLNKFTCLDIGKSLQVLHNPANDRMSFWDSIENLSSKM